MPRGFKRKIVAFVDVLGFSSLVKRAEAEDGVTLEIILESLEKMRAREISSQIVEHGPVLCPGSESFEKNLDYVLTQVSDSIVISCEATPVGALNLVNHCVSIVFRALRCNLLCRGYITVGSVYHSGRNVIGSAYMRAAKMEPTVTVFAESDNECGTPFVEIDPEIIALVRAGDDGCLWKMLKRCILTDGALYAVNPFRGLLYMSDLRNDRTYEQCKRENDLIRQDICKLINMAAGYISKDNERAMHKFRYYKAALDKLLAECDEVDRNIDMLYSPFPRNTVTRR